MIRQLVILWVFAVSVAVPTGQAAEIATECPQLNDQGQQLLTRKLVPETLPLKRIRQETRNLLPPIFGTEVEWFFWQQGVPPVTDAAFLCRYEDGSELYVPIVGMLLRCRVLMIELRRVAQWPIICTSETDPGLLLTK